MDVKIGVEHIGRELAIETDESREEITAALNTALNDPSAVLTLSDSKGRQLIVPGSKIAYIELGEEHARQVGFGAL